MSWAVPVLREVGYMALKIYKVGELTYQYEEGKQPTGAVEVKTTKPQAKQRTPRNKSRKTTDKAAENAD